MTDVRTRLADALREAAVDRTSSVIDRQVEALLSLPGIAIVELPEPVDSEWPCIGIGTDVWVNPLTGFVRFQANQFDPGAARSVAAALMAAANAAEADQ